MPSALTLDTKNGGSDSDEVVHLGRSDRGPILRVDSTEPDGIPAHGILVHQGTHPYRPDVSGTTKVEQLQFEHPIVADADHVARHKPGVTDEPELSGAVTLLPECPLMPTAGIEVQHTVRVTVGYQKGTVSDGDEADRLSDMVFIGLPQDNTVFQDERRPQLGGQEPGGHCGQAGHQSGQHDNGLIRPARRGRNSMTRYGQSRHASGSPITSVHS
ncbi:MAG: hypothetical protein OXE96_08555 [Gemmatimonadetes bacterium]|nr:hypothetical protein [Gemmatimonadota bacterium]